MTSMVKKIKHTPLNMALQAARLKAAFPNSYVTVSQNLLTWNCEICPSPLSDLYHVKMVYKKGNQPNVYVTEPKLAMYPGKKSLPHVYNTSKQWLCLYYRKAKQFEFHMPIIDTIIPWISEWLLHYELWVSTGSWHGGGIHHETEAEKQAEKSKEKIEEKK